MKNYLTTLLLVIIFTGEVFSQFVHPGGLHTQADLDRMKTKVAEGASPWIEGWNELIQDPLAQNTFVASPIANMGSNRQGASRDAHAAYLNAIRWYISEDDSYADAAIGILNDWSSTVNQIPSGGEFVGLGGIAIAEFAMAAEVMRISSRWQTSDFNRFKDMMVNYLYPVCHDFLTNHNGRCVQYYWANWDANNIMALMAIGVLCDNQAIFDEGVDYYQNGGGTGSIQNAVPFIHSGNLGQWQEMGRDQTHGFLGVGFLATACQIAWNQGIDLFGYDNNRLLAGAEYVAKYNLGDDVPFSTYDNCQDLNQDWPAINGRGIFHDRPVYEMVYNHYAVREGLSAPYSQKMAEIMRPEVGSRDHFGYGTLTFTLNPSSFPVHPVPPAPTNVTATAGTGRVFIEWEPSTGHTMRGYNLQRATSSGGPYTTISSSDLRTTTHYTDTDVANGTTYYYRVAGFNQAGTGAYSVVSGAMPLATGSLPSGWSKVEIGSHDAGNAAYANASGGTFVVNGYGTGIGGTADNITYAYRQTTGDGTITGRISSKSGSLAKTGIMIRESLDADAKTVSMTLGEGGGRFARMGYRTATGENMASTLGNTYTWVPAWFRITRSGNTFTAYESSDGATWFEVASTTISMSSSYYVGLSVASGNATSQNTTIFDNVTISGVGGGDQVWLEAECGTVGSLWNTSSGGTASNGEFATIQSGNNSTGSAPANSNGHITYNFNINSSGSYTLWARVVAPTPDDDSFWVRMDGGSWLSWNDIAPGSTEWTWDDVTTYSLSSGSHTLTIAYREDGAQLDKLYLATSGSPSGTGGSATNCSSSGSSSVWLEAECGTVGSLWNTSSGGTASNGQFATIQSGNNSTGSAPTNSNGHITYNFNINSSGSYTLWARVVAPTPDDDSFWVRMDGGSWLSWNDIAPGSTSWAWDDIAAYSLSSGSHTVTIAYREDGAQLDKLYLATSGSPSGTGGSATNCTPPSGGGSFDGYVVQIENRGTGLVADGYGYTANGDPVNQYASSTTHPNSHWEMIDAGSSQGTFYYLQNEGTGMKMDGMGRTTNGDDVGQYASSTTDINAQWIVEQYDGIYYRISNRGTGLYLDGMGSTANGSVLGQYANTTHVNAQWELVTISSGARLDDLDIAKKSVETEIQFYPNPVSSVLTLMLPEEFGKGEVKVFDLSGKLALEIQLSIEKPQVNVNSLEPGVYVLQITGKDTKAWSKKFIKIKE